MMMLFSLLHDKQRFDELQWLAGSLLTAMVMVVMQITKTTLPPAGALALLTAVSLEIMELGWLVVVHSHSSMKAELYPIHPGTTS